jgi:hypothetical protein
MVIGYLNFSIQAERRHDSYLQNEILALIKSHGPVRVIIPKQKETKHGKDTVCQIRRSSGPLRHLSVALLAATDGTFLLALFRLVARKHQAQVLGGTLRLTCSPWACNLNDGHVDDGWVSLRSCAV